MKHKVLQFDLSRPWSHIKIKSVLKNNDVWELVKKGFVTGRNALVSRVMDSCIWHVQRFSVYIRHSSPVLPPTHRKAEKGGRKKGKEMLGTCARTT